MDFDKPMSLLLVEDDVAECVRFKDCATERDDIRFIGMTGSSFEGINLVKTHAPEGVILDLELHKGKGSGLQFLADLREVRLPLRPLVVVTTNTSSGVVYSYIHDNGADLVFYKQQADYSAELVINALLTLRGALHIAQSANLRGGAMAAESPEQRRVRAAEKIDSELDLIGIAPHLKGRGYLFEAIEMLLTDGEEHDMYTSDSVFNQIAINRGVGQTGVTRAMATAIRNAWQRSPIEELQKHYTARINYQTGLPTPTEFVYFYRDKIKKFL